MPLSVVATGYGVPASERLHDAVARAKQGEPLAPVTVVVPTNSVGVAARRRLAAVDAGTLTPAGRGVVGVTFLTVYRLAELLGAPRLAAAGRRPVSTPVVASAVRRALARAPGMFAPVAEHPATEEALVAAHRELADLDEAQLDALAAHDTRAREVVRLHHATRTLLADEWFDEQDLMAAAGDALHDGSPLLRDIGAVVCFLPQQLRAPAARLLRALADHAEVTVIAGLTGSRRADASVHASLRRLGVGLDDAESSDIPLAVGTKVVSASDADDEVRAIVRGVVDAMRAGVPLERMAVLYGVDQPYARLLHEHLQLAGIAHNGAAVRTLTDSVLGRALIRLLAIGDGALRREDVTGLLAAVPMLDGRGRRAPAIEWERLSRKAGVIAGIDEWRSRLDAYAAALGTSEWHERERARADALRAFVDALASELDGATQLATWRELAQFAHRVVRRFVGDDARRSRAAWPALEQEAARRVEAVIDRLGTLDSVDPKPTLAVFRRTLELELDSARDLVGRLGEGLLAAPVGFALGVELDRVWVCGLAEGVFPSVPHDDPLLSDAERSVLGGELRLKAERIDDAERGLLAALASTAGERVCTWPRGNLRRSTEHVPSRFLLPTLETLDDSAVVEIASHAQGVATVSFPATRHELGVRAARAGAKWVRALPPVARARELIGARNSAAFTRFDGNLAGLGAGLRAIGPLDSDRVVSPTRLERWASCPHAYFMQYVLHVEPVERPEEILQLSPLDRGSIVHEVLHQFVDEAAGGPRDRTRLRALAEAACDEAEARGVTGRRLLWERDRRVIFAELDQFFDADESFRIERAAETLATELPFGLGPDGAAPVELRWPDGRRLLVRGQADRVDRTADGTLVVIDYKTGSFASYIGLSAEDPVPEGTHLQLPVYAHAARVAFADGAAPTEAYYWFVGRGNNRLIGYVVDDAVEELFLTAVRTIVDSIEAGVFVASPPPPGPRPFVLCAFCDPDGLGTTDRFRDWERKYGAPELAGLRSLSEVEA